MIGTLKAMGARNGSIRKIFLYHAAYIVGLGLLFGNIVGIGLCMLQLKFGLLHLPEKNHII